MNKLFVALLLASASVIWWFSYPGAPIRTALVCIENNCFDIYGKPRGRVVLDGIAVWGLAGTFDEPRCQLKTCTIKTLYDQSGNGLDLTQSDSDRRPIL